MQRKMVDVIRPDRFLLPSVTRNRSCAHFTQEQHPKTDEVHP